MFQVADWFSDFFSQLGFEQLLVIAVFMFILFVVVFLCVYFIPYVVYKDAKRRDMNQFFWLFVHFIGFLSLFVPGFIIHLYYRWRRNPIGGKKQTETETTDEYHEFEHPNKEQPEENNDKNDESEIEADGDVDLNEAFEEY